ncbi:NAD-dependent succinate-semialdehyde dehydrogenase [Lyngbya confervoides]|uniref:NAD-dependent succinate-semialdehyde dehydrogenase n=1 Tax=Lyngbya confervoides BDU141951 TaxID=1574623 RepID=A0ABD4T0H0_9CYAN|nr:NAD-dependent succinate-semialdehyde dehydrogenase [Lyngbya confervoides]MCM1982113.1 NAD-dependent succinate-semialdehyde dehydrogenase [Lyngbya confervoides BDU141951]
MGIATINPATGQLEQSFNALTAEQVARKIDLSAAAFDQYQRIPLHQRRVWMNQAAAILEDDGRSTAMAQLMTREMGKPIQEAIAEVKKCAWVCHYYADHAAEFLQDQPVQSDGSRAWISFQPLGTILAVMPWNFPFWQVFRFAAPALMAGNVALLKHASNVPQCALQIEAIFKEAGFPSGVFQTLLIQSDRVEQILKHPQVQGVALTGSEPAGASVAALAGSQIKPSVLELGGSDPFIVMPSANLEAAVKTAVKARILNSGQSCIAAKRFILAEPIAEAFLDSFVAAFQDLKVGDPQDPQTQVGPLATADILDTLEDQVARAQQQGAKALVGGIRDPHQSGNFYPPTILVDLPVESDVAQEEFFGPVALVFRVSDIESAIQLANWTEFGLGASAWTQDAAERDRFVRELVAGSVFINGMVKSDPRLPFGGIKKSGYGRELSQRGIYEFVNVKTVWIQ